MKKHLGCDWDAQIQIQIQIESSSLTRHPHLAFDQWFSREKGNNKKVTLSFSG